MGGCCSKWGPGQPGNKELSKGGGNTPKLNRLQHKESFSQKNGTQVTGGLEKGSGDGYKECYTSEPVKPLLSDSGENSLIVDNLEGKLDLQSETPSPDFSIKADLESEAPEDIMHLNSEVSSISNDKTELKPPELDSSSNSSNNVDKSDTTREMHKLSLNITGVEAVTVAEKNEWTNCNPVADSEERLGDSDNISRSSIKSLTIAADNNDEKEISKIAQEIGEDIDGIISTMKNSGLGDEECVMDAVVNPEPQTVPAEDAKVAKVESNIIVNPLQDSDESTKLASYVQTITIESTITEENKIENRPRSIVIDDVAAPLVKKGDILYENVTDILSSENGAGDVDESCQSDDISCASGSVSFEVVEDTEEQSNALCINVSKIGVEDVASNINVNVSDAPFDCAVEFEVTDGSVPKNNPQLSPEVCEKQESKGEKTIDNGEPNDIYAIKEDGIDESRPSSEASIMSQRSIFFENLNKDTESNVQNSAYREDSEHIRIYENFDTISDLPPPPLPEEIPPPLPEGDRDVNEEPSGDGDLSTFPPPPQDDLKHLRDQMLLQIDPSTNPPGHMSTEASKPTYDDNLIAPPCSSYVSLVSPTGFGSSSRY